MTMKKRLLSILLMCCMVLTLLPTAAFAEDSTETPPVCSCETTCTADNMNTECPVCGAENAIPQNCGQYIPVEDRTGENGSTEGADDPNGPTELSAADQVQAMINALPSAEAITEENAEEVEAQLEAIDEAKEKLSDEEIDELDMTRYAEAAAALGALVAPMLLANDSPDEQFSLAPGGRYYFDLSGANIPGTANGSLPDSTLHYVPFTYAGTVNAYKLTTEMATTEEHAQKNKYPHSLFVADYAVTNDVSWNALNTADLIFSKNYASGGVDYTLRTPSAGSGCTGLADSQRGVPQSNEWDTMLNKNSGYIQNWNGMYSWGQDVSSGGASYRAVRGYGLARYWDYDYATHSYPYLGFRPVLEVLNSDTLGSGGLKVVTLDLGGGTLGNSSEDIQIIVKTGSEFTAPASDGLTRPDGDAGSFFMWLGSNGKFYAPGDSVPAEVTKLTAQWTAPTYAVTLNTNGGTINSGNVTSYTYGVGATLPTAGDMTYTGHTFVGWYDNENLTGSPIAAIGGTETGNKEYWAKWEINQYTITFDTAGGSVVTPITQNYGTATTAPADPTKTGYTFAGWDRAIPATMPAENLTITAQWTVNQYTIAYDLAGGTAEGNPDTYTIETGAFTLKNPTKSGYTFTGWSGTGLDGENNMTVTIPTGSTGNRTYTAHWRYNGSGHSYSYYTIKATAGAGGSISPSGDVSVREGRDQTFTITPDKGYAVANVKIDGKSIGAVKSYTFENVSRTHTIEVIFMKANGNPQTGVFVDVATGSYYEDAVDWAVENGITKGTDDTHFSPDGICTRAQAVTFLWRTAGSPKPETRAMPFTDVPVGSYYYDAVLWAVENGITKGTSDTTFSPNMTCSRAQIVAFLWRSEKSPAAGTANPFADVKSTAYYADAVLWAVKENITKGTTSTTFSPNADCTRAQIVTFLWRCKK
ncbi:S-layer homology domain-containing protein [Adlercreutzia equolifaciens]|uniref:S-layer homology domain-containing protein n=1 Tax=Adlercreutzia equolifaciens TaxID=446660 RepID=UPI0035203583